MARRGFLATLHREIKRAAREAEREQRASQRAHAAAVREAEAARKREMKAYEQAQRASAADQKRLEKEAKERHLAAMAAEVERMNMELSTIAEDLEGILAATLDVDDFVDLESLKVKAVHPPFMHTQLEIETSPPVPVPDPPEPTLNEPLPPKGLFSVFGKKKHEKNLAKAHAFYESEYQEWRIAIKQAEAMRVEAAARYEEAERQRLETLQIEQDRYEAECAEREQAAAERNRAVDELIANLGYGIPDAIEDYIGIVISNAVYPDHFPVEHEYTYLPDSAELTLRVLVPAPDQISTVKSYKYTKATDEITEVQMSAKACKDRYSGAIHQVALRAAHEIFEADRRALIRTISLEVGAHAINPATGVAEFIPFVAMGVGREEFLKLELSNVVPEATLAHLGASLSKNSFGLVPAIVSGVRRS